MEDLGFTNISNNFHAFQTMAPVHVISRNAWTLLVLLTFSIISNRQFMENVGLTNISNNFHAFQTMAAAHVVSRNSWNMLVLPTFSMLPTDKSWKMLV